VIIEDQVKTLLLAAEKADLADRDSLLFGGFYREPNSFMERQVRVRLYGIIRENHLAEDALDSLWDLLGLERHPPE